MKLQPRGFGNDLDAKNIFLIVYCLIISKIYNYLSIKTDNAERFLHKNAVVGQTIRYWCIGKDSKDTEPGKSIKQHSGWNWLPWKQGNVAALDVTIKPNRAGTTIREDP